MNGSGFATIDYIIFGAYIVLLICLGLFLSRNKGGKEKNANDYFLAGNTLTWWAVGASLIAANISAEQFIGMSGSGYKIGLCIAAYELMAAAALVVVGKFLLPVMIERKIFTIPQFLRERYNNGVGLAFSIFWLFLYVFVNLTSVAWLGALAIEQILGISADYRIYIIIALFVIAGIYSIYGGLSAVAWTDVMQVVFLVGGGLITAYFALDAVSGEGHGALDGFSIIFDKLKEVPNDTHFNLIVDRAKSPESYKDLPGIAAIVGGIWITNLGYWGFNQYIIQKGLAAKSLKDAKKGLIFAGFLKILIPFIVVLPGICAFVISNYPEAIPGLQDGSFNVTGEITRSDDAYPWMIHNFTPIGIKGLSFAALAAAIISSLASMFNSTSTIFTMDIYKQYINKKASEKKLVQVGRITALSALVIAAVAVEPLLGGLDQAFQYIQEYSGFIYPGICIVFGLGLLWKRASAKAAVWTSIATIPAGVFFKVFFPEVPFQFRMGYVFIILFLLFVALTYSDKTRVSADEMIATDQARMLKWGRLTGIAALICFVVASAQKLIYISGANIEWINYLDGIGFQAFFCTAALFAFASLVCFSDARDAYKDPKSLKVELGLFHTDRSFNLGALGIFVILALLYIIFW
jgi:SSS family solute:Na+ symporter